MSKDEKIIRTTIRVPETLWMKTRQRAIQERTTAQELVIMALQAYLKGGR
jgi:hypothetical protein